jgi:hypothetical protein
MACTWPFPVAVILILLGINIFYGLFGTEGT